MALDVVGKQKKVDASIKDLRMAFEAFVSRAVAGDVKGMLERAVFAQTQFENVVKAVTGKDYG